MILFVDDRPETNKVFMELLEEKGVKVHWAETLDEAVDMIAEHTKEIEGVIIDLHMPGCSRLDHYQDRYTVTINQGQSLGLYLAEKYPNIAYFYCSNVPTVYDKPTGIRGRRTRY